MNILQALGVLLLGVGLGALLIWIQQTAARRQFRKEMETRIDQALFVGPRRQRLVNIRTAKGTFGPDSRLPVLSRTHR